MSRWRARSASSCCWASARRWAGDGAGGTACLDVAGGLSWRPAGRGSGEAVAAVVVAGPIASTSTAMPWPVELYASRSRVPFAPHSSSASCWIVSKAWATAILSSSTSSRPKPSMPPSEDRSAIRVQLLRPAVAGPLVLAPGDRPDLLAELLPPPPRRGHALGDRVLHRAARRGRRLGRPLTQLVGVTGQLRRPLAQGLDALAALVRREV